ncbi:dolichol kinase [Candidatus Bathyarchaeota archaeon]|nr:MAG: dolichol kinase [Candidatus Bathyarchaeota archaeon]
MISPEEVIIAIALFAWILLLTSFLTRKLYDLMIRRGLEHGVAVYYNRKIVHIFAGGLVAFIAPFYFESPLIPSIFAAILAIMTYIPHRTGKLLYWFQVPENMYEVHFCIMWGVGLAAGWLLTGNPWFGALPIIFMSIGDAVTGLLRNAMFKRRTKSWWGNLAMAITTIPIGATILGIPGAIAALICSFVEHYEFGVIDDNITVPLTALLLLIALTHVFNF